jgi:hypothetical protein
VVRVHVASLLGPFIGLLSEDRADEADDRGAVGEDPDDVGAAADFLVEAFLWVVRPDLAPDLVRERGEREEIVAGLVEVVCRVRVLAADRELVRSPHSSRDRSPVPV